MFVKCNPRGGNANCLTYRSPEMKLSADLLDKLPASATQYIGAELVEEEPVTEQKQPEVETAMFLPEDGSGGFEGSAVGLPFVMADGSGKYWTEVETPQGMVDSFADTLRIA
ncbi:hypothetical protein N1851_011026 [Merluccius polli]|uniref:Uncharacterized protein n=1 Tax=Merluccius polli TaxID=89951 RepID=A0AA47MYX9_MERPO|nr:hypothetical protein N1851_011026 [Merluccius polli]